jgi:hypothetical protein
MTYSYKWLDSEKKIIKRTSSDGLITFIPLDSDNLDYQGYLEWEAIDGNNIEEISTTLTWDDIREKRNGLLISTDWTMT